MSKSMIFQPCLPRNCGLSSHSYIKPKRETIFNSIFTHSWWRASVPPAALTQTHLHRQFHKAPLLLPISDPYAESVLLFGNRPTIDGAPTPPRPSVPFLGLTDILMTYLAARAAEQEHFVAKSVAAGISVSRSMRIFNAPYLEQSHVSFPVSAMHVPRAEDWPTQLHRPISYNVAYPVHDLSVRYMEELMHAHPSVSHLPPRNCVDLQACLIKHV